MTEVIDSFASNIVTGVTLVFWAKMYQIMVSDASKNVLNIYHIQLLGDPMQP